MSSGISVEEHASAVQSRLNAAETIRVAAETCGWMCSKSDENGLVLNRGSVAVHVKLSHPKMRHKVWKEDCTKVAAKFKNAYEKKWFRLIDFSPKKISKVLADLELNFVEIEEANRLSDANRRDRVKRSEEMQKRTGLRFVKYDGGVWTVDLDDEQMEMLAEVLEKTGERPGA